LKRVLFIAFFFPPIGGAGVQRSLKFVRYLPESGWRATVLTSRARYWMHDESLLAELPPETRVLRAPFWGGRLAGGGATAGARSHARVRFLRLLARTVLVPDAYVGWILPAFRMARRELARERYDAILTTSSPDSAHLLGRRLKRLTGIPWVADFRDPWTRRLAYAPPTRLHDALHRRLERSCLREADRVVVTAEETRRDFLARAPELSQGKITVIPNGFDEDDFTNAETLLYNLGAAPGLAQIPHAPILHAGQLNPERPIAAYLEGLRLFAEREPARASLAETLFLGGHYDRDREEVERRGLGALVRFQGGCPHALSVAALLRSRILLLLEQDSDRGRLLLPGKIFEYLRARRPILAVVPRGGAADRLVRECQAGWVADPSRPDSIAEGISRLIEDDRLPAETPPIDRFERRSLARELARVLDSIG
jgi:glycosyltransferase involved in cell wall biosynthesis